MSRRPHPYFGQLNRLEQALAVIPCKGGRSVPAMAPDEQQGVLWAAFRENPEPA